MTKQIITSREYTQDILNLALNHDLVLLDLDDVVLTTKQYLCGSQWYHRYHEANKDLLTSEELSDNIYGCMGATEYTHVSLQLIKDFSELSKNKMVFGLTARRIEFASQTDNHLSLLEVKFSENIPQADLFQNGIIYVGYEPGTAAPNDKGAVLNTFLQNNYFGDVKSIILIDDSLKNLQNVYNALDDGIEFTGIHYTKVATELSEKFSEDHLEIIGRAQYDHFTQHGSFLSDEAALSKA